MSEQSPPPPIPPESPSPSPSPSPSSSEGEQWSPAVHNSERKLRFPRACTARSSSRLRYPPSPPPARRRKPPQGSRPPHCRVITQLVQAPESEALVPRWELRSMWELASLLDFLHVFRPLLNIHAEFSAEELETALITPNSTLDDIHIPILKAIPPITRMALGRATWVTVLCRKLRDWWYWVAEGDIPIIASHGMEIEIYKTLEPATRVLILKALCDIRVEQDDIRRYIDSSIKHGMQLSTFRRERVGGDSHGVSYWYEDDPVIGHRLYRENRQIESKKIKGKGTQSIPLISCQWETVATNLDEFQEVSDKLFSSVNKTEVSLGKKLKIDILPEVEKLHKKREKSLKKQHRQALLLDNFLNADGLTSGRSLRDRKPVTYTFDDFDRSINEAIKITKRPSSPEQQPVRKEVVIKPDMVPINGKLNGPSHISQHFSYDTESPKFDEYEDTDAEVKSALDRSNRRRKRPQRYSAKEFVEAISENEADFDSDDDIVGEAVYDEEYLRNRKQRKMSSSSEGDEEYSWEGENAEEEEEEEAEDSLSGSEDSNESRQPKKFPTRNRRHGTKLRSVDDLQMGPRRSKRSTRPRINYRQYELSESDAGSTKPEKSNVSGALSDASNDPEHLMPSQDSRDEDGVEMKVNNVDKEIVSKVDEQKHNHLIEKANDSCQEGHGARQRRYLDLNELAPSAGFDDGTSPPNT